MFAKKFVSVSALALALAAPAAARAGEPPAGEAAPRFSREAVARVVAEHHDEIQDCYEDALAAKNANRRKARGGRVVMTWMIAPGGHVEDVKVKRTTLGDPQVTACMAGAIAGWEFPAPTRPQPIVFPFDLRPESGAERKGESARERQEPERG